MNNKKMMNLSLKFDNSNSALNLMGSRLGNIDIPHYKINTVDGVNEINKHLFHQGGFSQQNRMIRDKRKSLNKSLLYSYQSAWVEKVSDGMNDGPVRALINPDKLKMDYDDKIISIGFENHFHVGDIFEWKNTNSYWMVYLQDLTELAYFRAEIRRCTQILSWIDENGEQQSTMASIRGPIETKIDSELKHGLSYDLPNYTLKVLIPQTEATVNYFKRYNKFYLSPKKGNLPPVCWKVESTNWIDSPDILEFTAIEYYSNKDEDDLENGVVGALKTEPIDPNPDQSHNVIFIVGETFIKPQKEYIYTVGGNFKGHWSVDKKYPVILTEYKDENNFSCVKVKWTSTYSGQFDLQFNNKYSKTIVVESLF